MDIIPFINKNGIWQLDKPEYLSPQVLTRAPLFLVELGIVTLLDELASNFFTSLQLEFHYKPIHPHDALLIKIGARYKCVSLMGEDVEIIVFLPSLVFKAMETNNNPERIYIRIGSVLIN